MADKKLNALTAAAAFTSTCSVAGSDSATPTGSFLFTKALFDAAYGQLGVANTWTGQQVINNGTVTSDTPALIVRQTWNNAGVQFNGVLVDITNTASTGPPNIINLKVNTASVANITKDGNIQCAGGFQFNTGLNAAVLPTGLFLAGAYPVTWSSGVNPISGMDTGLGRNAAGVVEINSGTPGTLRDLTLRNLVAVDNTTVVGTTNSKFVWTNGGVTANNLVLANNFALNNQQVGQDGQGAQFYGFTNQGSDPSAPTSSAGFLYCKTVGGKHALFIRFPTGAVQQIAIEP